MIIWHINIWIKEYVMKTCMEKKALCRQRKGQNRARGNMNYITAALWRTECFTQEAKASQKATGTKREMRRRSGGTQEAEDSEACHRLWLLACKDMSPFTLHSIASSMPLFCTALSPASCFFATTPVKIDQRVLKEREPRQMTWLTVAVSAMRYATCVTWDHVFSPSLRPDAVVLNSLRRHPDCCRSSVPTCDAFD